MAPNEPDTAAGLTVMQAHLAVDCPDRATCWARDVHDAHDPTALDAQECHMTTATIEASDEVAEATPRRIVLVTLAVLLPPQFEDADIADIAPVSLRVTGAIDLDLSAFIETKVQEARLVMT